MLSNYYVLKHVFLVQVYCQEIGVNKWEIVYIELKDFLNVSRILKTCTHVKV